MSPRIAGDGLAWFDQATDEHKRRCVANFLASLAEGTNSQEAIPLPGEEDLSFVSFVPACDVVVTFMPVPELDVVFVDLIEDLDR